MVTKKELSNYLAKLGSKGGRARAENLTVEQRREIGRKAAKARWAGKGKKRAQAE
jgi:hypothetical protein